MNRITYSGSKPYVDDPLRADCHGVLLPVVSDLVGPRWLEQLLRGGTASILLGETRAEYVARRMSAERRQAETASDLRGYVDAVSPWARGELLVAVDQEPWGIQRLHSLVPSYPDPSQILRTPLTEIRDNAQAIAEAAKELGISMFLSPVLDVLEGANPWLEGRTLQAPAGHDVVGSVAAAYVAGTQSGKVATVVKHFPGFPCLARDPALEATAVVDKGQWDPRSLQPFHSAVRAGTAAVMLGPAIVADVDTLQPASTSPTVVERLRGEVGFGGLIVSDDLDAPATLRGRSLTMTMIDSLGAGADLLLVGGGEHLLDSVEAIYERALADGRFALRVRAAAERVRSTARSFAASPQFEGAGE